MPSEPPFSATVMDGHDGTRLDAWVALHIPGISRTQARRLIRAGEIQVDAAAKRPAYRVRKGDRITGKIPKPLPDILQPESLPLHILHEDDDIIVLNKPPGVVVHPAAGHFSGTLVHALLYRFPELTDVGTSSRPGIVHRLDKDTSGLLLVARNHSAYTNLLRQFKSRQVIKRYLAIVRGSVEEEKGEISLPIGRDPRHRKRMSTVSPRGRMAQTEWRVRERFAGATLFEVDLKTGRTHQIRVHCAAMGFPVVGDTVYGGKRVKRRSGSKKPGPLDSANRQMLHAWRLQILHPSRNEPVSFEAPVSSDMQELIEALRKVWSEN